MAIVDIAEYRTLARDERNDVVATGVEPASVDQQVSIGALCVDAHDRLTSLLSELANLRKQINPI